MRGRFRIGRSRQNPGDLLQRAVGAKAEERFDAVGRMKINRLVEAIVKILDGIAIIERAKRVGYCCGRNEVVQFVNARKNRVRQGDEARDGIQITYILIAESWHLQEFGRQGARLPSFFARRGNCGSPSPRPASLLRKCCRYRR